MPVLPEHDLTAVAGRPAARGVASAVAVFFALLVGVSLTSGPASASTGVNCTIRGTAAADTLRGTPGDDVICAGAGNDRIFGGGGDDQIFAGFGADRIFGGAGSDSARGGPGTDFLGGNPGNDILDGGINPDRLDGGPGDDILNGGPGTDGINPGTGSNTCAPDSTDRVNGACAVDDVGPAFSWVDVPATVEAGTTFTATFSLEDPSGIATGSATASIGGAPGWITTWCGFRMEARLVSGTETDGIWSVSCGVPENAVSDPYSLWAGAQDNLGNSTLADWAEFVVVGGSDDNQAPVISDVSIPASVQPGETATITWRAADPSGVAGTYPWAYLPGPPWGVLYGPGIGRPERISGDANDGTYSQTFTLPADSPPGTYAVYISVRDELGNRTYEQYGSFSSG